jgi:hypothetical protein
MGQTAALVNVPKAAVDKDHLFSTGEADIRTAGKGAGEAIPVSEAEEEPSDRQLRPRVAAANAPHVLAAADRHPSSLLSSASAAQGLCSSVTGFPALAASDGESLHEAGVKSNQGQSAMEWARQERWRRGSCDHPESMSTVHRSGSGGHYPLLSVRSSECLRRWRTCHSRESLACLCVRVVSSCASVA